MEFSSLPSVILFATLFRLAITITTTRLILLQARRRRHRHRVRQFVVGGNIAVGLVIFLIITIAQFIVITKGAERVAEVAARFTLDAMPGKQMSIDADLRNGDIDQAEAAGCATAGAGEPALRRDGRRHEIRQGRRHRGHRHHPGQPDRRLRGRHAAAWHVARRGRRRPTRC